MSEEKVEIVRSAYEHYSQGDFRAAAPHFGSEVLEVRDLGGDSVIVVMRARGHGRDSGTPFEVTLWQASKWRRGRVVWWQMFGSEAEALDLRSAIARSPLPENEAAGLSE